MEGRRPGSGGLTLLDVAALVTGAAVASVHIRGAVADPLAGSGRVLIWTTFVGVAVTAAGPLVFLVRRFGHRPPGYPRVGDLLWTLLGAPWIFTALVQASAPGGATRRSDLYVSGLSVGLGVACLVALVVVWKTWVIVPAERLARDAPAPWTHTVGLTLAVLWPLQCGFGLVVSGPR